MTVDGDPDLLQDQSQRGPPSVDLDVNDDIEGASDRYAVDWDAYINKTHKNLFVY